jgi:bifunctional UDP-N-acetylglucosamine pyrophosphorylase/glucosamine-1-phosphate N-acetyltransferase
MNIVILAAGQGKRMRSDLPKVLHPLAGKPMLAHVLDSGRAAATLLGREARVVVVVGHGGSAVRSAFAAADAPAWALQEPQLGTGHAVQQAMEHVDPAAPVLVLYGDVPLVRPQTLAALVQAAGAGVAVLTVHMDDPTGYGRVLRNGDGGVQAIVEERDADAAQRAVREVNTGILVLPGAHLAGWLAALSNANAQGEYYLTDVVAAARRDGVAVAALAVGDPVEAMGVNSKAQLAQAERAIQARHAAALLEAGTTLADPARIDVRGRLAVGSDVSIDVGCVFEGEVELGRGVQIGPYCVLRDVRIGDGSVVQAFSHLDGATVGESAQVGPYARLRPGAELEAEVQVGNFVEVKSARLERGAKAKHLAYVGDARVGAGSNIGAGTIFANHDGVNKHRSDVGAGVRVGSNTVLVAPVQVGDGATIGAGSTITRAAPAGQLTVARARQVVVPGWQPPRRKPGKSGA